MKVVLWVSLALGFSIVTGSPTNAPPAAGAGAGGSRDLALSLLKQCAETQARLVSYVYTEEVLTELQARLTEEPYRKMSGYNRRLQSTEVRTDGNRTSVRFRLWGNVSSANEFIAREHSRYNSCLWDGKIFFEYVANMDIPGRIGFQTDVPAWFEDMRRTRLWSPDIAKELQGQGVTLSVRQNREQVGPGQCYVIDARTPKGQYTLWIDPERGHNIVQTIIRRQDPPDIYTLERVECRNIEGVWIPVEGYVRKDGSFRNGDYLRGVDHLQITKITLNPDHEAARAFVPDDVKNGAHLSLGPYTEGKYSSRDLPLWQDGKLVEKSGKVIDVRELVATTKFSLLKSPLPPLTNLSKDLSQAEASGKPLLVCLCDIEQRPSRRCLSDLAKKASALTAEGVTLVIVQTAKVDLKRHESWLKAEKIDLPIRMCEGDFDAQKAAWAVKALPWLILTDKSHIVRAEGFGIGELERRVKEIEEPKP